MYDLGELLLLCGSQLHVLQHILDIEPFCRLHRFCPSVEQLKNREYRQLTCVNNALVRLSSYIFISSAFSLTLN